MRCAAAIATVLLPWCGLARAGARLISDDAAIVESKSCQLESWIEYAQGARAFWAVPACNLAGHFELSVGGAIRDTGPVANNASPKHVLREGTAVALSHRGSGSRSESRRVECLRRRRNGDCRRGVQYEVLPRAPLLAEIFRDERGPGKFQVGTRYAFDPASIEAYVSSGHRLDSEWSDDTWWVIVGFRAYTKPFLP